VNNFALISDNRITFDVWLTYLPAPVATPTVESRPEGVFVFLSDLDDLAVWFEAASGVVERGPEFAGMRPWTLTVDTGPEFRGLVVHVSVLAMCDAQVMHTLVDAARLAVPLAQSPQAVA
jgi:hypothetical protein